MENNVNNIDIEDNRLKEISEVCKLPKYSIYDGCKDIAEDQVDEIQNKPFSPPVDFSKVTITSFFMEERIVFGKEDVHSAWDLAAGNKTPVKAVCDGTVKKVSFRFSENVTDKNGGGGNQIYLECPIDDELTYTVIYAHLYPNSSKVKEGIPIFQEETIGNLGNTYNNFIDPFKLLETEKNNNIFNLGINNFNMNMTDIQTRKIFEKEMEPYLMRMKNELNLIIERFRKELEVKSNHFNEIEEMKQEMIKIRQNSEDIYKNFELKFLNMNDNLNKHDKTLNNLQSEMFQMNHLNKSSNDIFLKNEIDNLKNKVINLDSNNEKYLNETTKNIEKIFDYKFDKINQNINFIKEENNSIKNELAQNNIKIEMINSENNKKNERLNDFNSEFNSISNQINKISIHNNKVMNLINNLEINNNECQQKMKNLNEKFSSLNENFDIINNETKNQKENFNSNLKLISKLESNLNA